jgi:hypothetical protein
MSWKVEKSRNAGLMIFEISGRLEGSELGELRRVLASASRRGHFGLDLKGVKLVDQDSVALLAACEAKGAELLNCPLYIRDWITRERSGE